MEWDRISTELSTEIYSQLMVMLQLKTKHQNLGNWTSSKYNPSETAGFGYLHYPGAAQPRAARSLASGDTHRCCGWGKPPAPGKGNPQHAGTVSEWSTITPRIQHLTCSSQEPPRTILLINSFTMSNSFPTILPVYNFLKIPLSQHNIQGRGKALWLWPHQELFLLLKRQQQ